MEKTQPFNHLTALNQVNVAPEHWRLNGKETLAFRLCFSSLLITHSALKYKPQSICGSTDLPTGGWPALASERWRSFLNTTDRVEFSVSVSYQSNSYMTTASVDLMDQTRGSQTIQTQIWDCLGLVKNKQLRRRALVTSWKQTTDGPPTGEPCLNKSTCGRFDATCHHPHHVDDTTGTLNNRCLHSNQQTTHSSSVRVNSNTTIQSKDIYVSFASMRCS